MFFFTNEAGDVIPFDELGIYPLNSHIETPSYEYIREQTDNGRWVTVDRFLQPRQITCTFLLKAQDFQDTYLLRDELYRLLAKENVLYFHEREIPYKRWRVEVETPSMGEKGYSHAYYEINLIATEGYGESVGKTSDLLRFDADKWQFGQGLTFEDKSYSFSKTKFSIYNAGDLTVDPRKMPLKITYRGTTTGLRIKNTTTGDEWRHLNRTNSTDRITLDGIFADVNGKNIFENTNMELITLAPGWNHFELVGSIGIMTIDFDFRFYYL